MKKLEIFGTLGPACCEYETLKEMLASGMNGIRLNLSHCNLDDREEWIQNYRKACEDLNMPCNLMIDIQGTELRMQPSDEIIPLFEGSSIVLSNLYLPKEIGINANVNDVLLIDDGKVKLKVEKNENGFLWCKSLNKSHLEGSKSIAIEGKELVKDTISQKDFDNLKNAKKYGVTSLMIPFVSSKDDLIMIKDILNDLNLDLKI